MDGDEMQVGVVSVCEPPTRIVFSWAPPVWSGATEVEVRFTSEGDEATTVHLEHRDFDALGTDAETTRDDFANGWAIVLQRFADRAAPSPTE